MYYKGKEVKALGHGNSDLQGFGKEIRKELSKRLPPDEDIRVLDVGTGYAITTEFLARTLSKGSTIWTLDPSIEVLRRARRSLKAKGFGSRIEFMHGSIGHLDMRDGFFDVLVSVMVLHHIEDLDSALGEMARVVRDHGRILIADYSPEAAHELKFRAEHREQDFFPARDVVAVLKEKGFSARFSDFGLWYLVESKS